MPKRETKTLENKIKEDSKRVNEINTLITKIYDDWLSGKIKEKTFNMLLDKYQSEQVTLEESITNTNKILEGIGAKDDDIEKWLNIIKKYTDTDTLDSSILNELIEKIIVHEREIVDGNLIPKIEIHYKFIGNALEGTFLSKKNNLSIFLNS